MNEIHPRGESTAPAGQQRPRRSAGGDTGIALHLAGAEPQGCHLENLVLQDLLAWRDARVERAELGYWRTTLGEEVDVVIEAGGKRLPIEVKATASPRLADCAHLRSFRAEYGAVVAGALSPPRPPHFSQTTLQPAPPSPGSASLTRST